MVWWSLSVHPRVGDRFSTSKKQSGALPSIMADARAGGDTFYIFDLQHWTLDEFSEYCIGAQHNRLLVGEAVTCYSPPFRFQARNARNAD